MNDQRDRFTSQKTKPNLRSFRNVPDEANLSGEAPRWQRGTFAGAALSDQVREFGNNLSRLRQNLVDAAVVESVRTQISEGSSARVSITDKEKSSIFTQAFSGEVDGVSVSVSETDVPTLRGGSSRSYIVEKPSSQCPIFTPELADRVRVPTPEGPVEVEVDKAPIRNEPAPVPVPEVVERKLQEAEKPREHVDRVTTNEESEDDEVTAQTKR